MSRTIELVTLVWLASWLLSSCTPEITRVDQDRRLGRLPERIIEPDDNISTPAKVDLGRLLFWDPILSGSRDISCATCHHPNHGYAEQLDLSIGVGGNGLSSARRGNTLVKRNSQSILNTAFNGINTASVYDPKNAAMFWDSRANSLESQALQPILSAEEMRGLTIAEENILDTIVLRLENNPEYTSLFIDAFGEDGISAENIGRAIASFERTLTSNQSRFDQYQDGDESALSTVEIRGMLNFIEVGCIACHNGPMLSDYKLHILTVPENEKLSSADRGDGNFEFRTPSLRNVTLTVPYMHNGVFNTLEEVLTFYDDLDDGSQNPHIDPSDKDELLDRLNFADDKVPSIISFLHTLTDEDFDQKIPDRVPSNLPPGGNIK